jgi:acyl carrier protein
MTTQSAVIRELGELPRSERMDFLVGIVLAQFKDALMMTEQDELPLDENYFDLGLNSLRVVEIKTGLEELLGREVDAGLLFSQPTVQQLLGHLAEEVLADLFASATAPVPAPTQSYTQSSIESGGSLNIVADFLRRIYEN